MTFWTVVGNHSQSPLYSIQSTNGIKKKITHHPTNFIYDIPFNTPNFYGINPRYQSAGWEHVLCPHQQRMSVGLIHSWWSDQPLPPKSSNINKAIPQHSSKISNTQASSTHVVFQCNYRTLYSICKWFRIKSISDIRGHRLYTANTNTQEVDP